MRSSRDQALVYGTFDQVVVVILPVQLLCLSQGHGSFVGATRKTQ